MLRRTLLTAIIFITCFATAQKRPLTFDDMMQLKRIGDFAVSPDGKWVTFSATDVSLAGNSRKTHLWIVPVAGGENRRLTLATGAGEDRLRFAPDGKRVLFITGSQVWTQDFDATNGALTGQPKQVTTISTEADGATWSPDGKSILFVSAVYPDCKDDACNKARDEAAEKSKVKAQVFTRLLYRHWNAYGNGKRSHLFLVPAEGGPARDLIPGDHDVPPFSLGGQDQYSFAPDSSEIAFTSNLDEVEATSTNSDVFTLSLKDPTAKPKNLTAENKGSDSTPMYSPTRSVTRTPNAPHSCAYAAKSGFTSEVCHTSNCAARCSFEILPSDALLSSTCVMFIPYFTAVVISIAYCPKPPSPVTATIGRSGAAAQAPMAAGKPKPIEPR